MLHRHCRQARRLRCEARPKICRTLDFEDFSSIETEFAELIPGLGEGRWDMTTGLFISEERRKLVDFTRPIWSLPDGLMVAKATPFS